MKAKTNTKLRVALTWDIGAFLTAVLFFVLKPGPFKSLFVAAPMFLLFYLHDRRERTDAGADLTASERKARLRVDLAGFFTLAVIIFSRALWRNDVDGWHTAAYELIIVALMLWLIFSEAPLWPLLRRKHSRFD
jgi:hypothetical protein